MQNFKIETIFFCRFYFRVARATSDRNMIHSADACFLVMACVGYSPKKLKTFSSLLKSKFKLQLAKMYLPWLS